MSALFSLLFLDPRLRKWRCWLAFTLFAAILIIGSVRGARAGLGHFATGLVLHSIAYGGLTLLLFTGFEGSARARAGKAVLTVATMGAVDESVQSMLSFRAGTWGDWLVDCNASVITAGLLWAFLPAPLPAAARRL